MQISTINTQEGSTWKPPLDDSDQFYTLSGEELAFFKTTTGITEDSVLKTHIARIQAKTYDIYAYPCIRHYAFTRLRITCLHAYKHLLQLGREREGAIFLDIGCCFGNDLRKAIHDIRKPTGLRYDRILMSDGCKNSSHRNDIIKEYLALPICT